MPGITGIIGRGTLDARHKALDQMVEVMRRESFYASGSYRNDRCGVAAGWVVVSPGKVAGTGAGAVGTAGTAGRTAVPGSMGVVGGAGVTGVCAAASAAENSRTGVRSRRKG